jgi:hypothetical protein
MGNTPSKGTKVLQKPKKAEKPSQIIAAYGSIGSAYRSRNAPLSKSKLIPKWEIHLDCYDKLIALKFTKEAFIGAADRLYSKEFRRLPFDLVAPETIILPAVAAPYFRDLKPQATPAVRGADVPTEDLIEARKRRSMGP